MLGPEERGLYVGCHDGERALALCHKISWTIPLLKFLMHAGVLIKSTNQSHFARQSDYNSVNEISFTKSKTIIIGNFEARYFQIHY